MVPIDTLTSMLLDPSSGSNSTSQPSFGPTWATGTMPSCSSEAIATTPGAARHTSIMMSSAARSRVFCTSPCTLVSPAVPSMSAVAP